MSCVRLSELGVEEKKSKVIRSVIAVRYLHQGAEITDIFFVLRLRLEGVWANLVSFLWELWGCSTQKLIICTDDLAVGGLWGSKRNPVDLLTFYQTLIRFWVQVQTRGLSADCMVLSGFLPQSKHTDPVGWETFAVWEQFKSNCAMFALKKADNVASSGLDGQWRIIEFFIVTATPGKHPHLCRGTSEPDLSKLLEVVAV